MSNDANRRERFDTQLAAFAHARRRNLGLSQAVLAEELGLDQATVSKVENGQRRLTAGETMQWLEALGMSAHDIGTQLSTLWEQFGERPSTLWSQNGI